MVPWGCLSAGSVKFDGPQCALIDITGTSQSGLRAGRVGNEDAPCPRHSTRKSVFLILPVKEESNWMQTHYISEALWQFLHDSIMMNVSGYSHARKCLKHWFCGVSSGQSSVGTERWSLLSSRLYPGIGMDLESPGLGLNLFPLLIRCVNLGELPRVWDLQFPYL